MRTGDGLHCSDIGAGFSQVRWKIDGTGTTHDVYTNDNILPDVADVALRLDGGAALGVKDFVDLTFRVMVADRFVKVIGGTSGEDTIYAMDVWDRLTGQLGAALIYGGSGNDAQVGTKGSDNLVGDAGSDTLNGGPGVDLIYSGAGDDVIKIQRSAHFAAGERIDGANGRDSLRFSSTMASESCF